MKHLHMTHSEFSLLAGEGHFHGEQMISHVMDMAAQLLPPHEPDFSRKLSELEHEKLPGHERDWEQWYGEQMADSVASESRRLGAILNHIKMLIDKLSEEDIQNYCRERLITDSFIGSEAKRAVLKKLAMEQKENYRMAEKGSTFDGFVGEMPVIIRHYEPHYDEVLDEMSGAATIFYEVHEDDIELMYELAG